MFATRSYIRALLEEVSRTPLDRTAARALVCALFDRNTPSFISEFLKDSFGQSPWQTIPKHLSFGILEEALDQRIEPTRSAVTRKLFRRLEAIAYSLEDEEQAKHFTNETERIFGDLYRGYLAAEEVLHADSIPAGTLTCLVEEILRVISFHKEVFIPLLLFRFEMTHNPRRHSFISQVRRASELGLTKIQSEESEICLDLTHPIPFKSSLVENEQFQSTIAHLDEILFSLSSDGWISADNQLTLASERMISPIATRRKVLDC